MTERPTTGGAGSWPALGRDRGISPTPTQIPPHPGHGDLPPCDSGAGKGDGAKRCPRPARWHYGYGYYCIEHMACVEAGEEVDRLSEALYWAKRFLWKAQVELLDYLDDYLGQAMSKIDEELMRAKDRMREAEEKAEFGL